MIPSKDKQVNKGNAIMQFAHPAEVNILMYAATKFHYFPLTVNLMGILKVMFLTEELWSSL